MTELCPDLRRRPVPTGRTRRDRRLSDRAIGWKTYRRTDCCFDPGRRRSGPSDPCCPARNPIGRLTVGRSDPDCPHSGPIGPRCSARNPTDRPTVGRSDPGRRCRQTGHCRLARTLPGPPIGWHHPHCRSRCRSRPARILPDCLIVRRHCLCRSPSRSSSFSRCRIVRTTARSRFASDIRCRQSIRPATFPCRCRRRCCRHRWCPGTRQSLLSSQSWTRHRPMRCLRRSPRRRLRSRQPKSLRPGRSCFPSAHTDGRPLERI